METNRVRISKTNEGPLVNIGAWIGMCVMILSVLARALSKWAVAKKLGLDDGLISISVMLAIAHTIMLSLMVTNGLGSPQETLSPDSIRKYQIFGYTSQLLYIPALYLGKSSTLVYLRALSAEGSYTVLNLLLEILLLIGGLGSEFTLAFQCKLPIPWTILSSSKCLNITLFWNVMGAFDVFTDLLIFALPAFLVWSIHMPTSKKALVVFIFGIRAFIIPLTIVRVYFLNTISSLTHADQTLTSYHSYLLTTIQLNFAIVAASLPFCKPFFSSMDSGALTSSVVPMDSSYLPPTSRFSTILSGMNSRSAYNSRNLPKLKGSIKLNSISVHETIVSSRQSLEIDDRISVVHPSFHYGNAGEVEEDLGWPRLDRVKSGGESTEGDSSTRRLQSSG